MKIDLQSLLNDIQFRDYRLEIIRDKFEAMLFVSARFMDREEAKRFYEKKESYSVWQSDTLSPMERMPSKRAKVGIPYPIPHQLDSIDMALKFIFYCIAKTEDHEMREDFYYKGERVFDPHIKK